MPVRRQPLVEMVRGIIAGKPSWGCKLVREALAEQGVKVGRHRLHRLWKAESLVATVRRELLDIEHFATLEVAQILANRWRRIYNEERPHCRAKGRPPATAYKIAQVKTA